MHKIAFDVDGCITNITPGLIKNIQSFIPNFCMGWIYEHDLSTCTGLSKTIIDWCVEKTLSDVENIKPYDGVIEYLSTLEEVIFITNRKVSDYTYDWLDLHLKNKYEIYFVCGSKVPILKELSITMFVEDKVENAIEIANSGIKVYLYDQQWNRYLKDYPNIERFYDWKEFTYGNN